MRQSGFFTKNQRGTQMRNKGTTDFFFNQVKMAHLVEFLRINNHCDLFQRLQS